LADLPVLCHLWGHLFTIAFLKKGIAGAEGNAQRTMLGTSNINNIYSSNNKMEIHIGLYESAIKTSKVGMFSACKDLIKLTI